MDSTSPLITHRQQGFSLIELMIAVTISLFLLLGVSYIFTGSKQTYRVEENLARMQESGRLAFEYISRDLRAAGDFGCASRGIAAATASGTATCTGWPADPAVPSLVCALDASNCDGTTAAKLNFNPAQSIYGYEASGPTGITIKADTDAIRITGSEPTAASITSDTAGTITANTVSGIAAGDILLASDCKSSVAFQACTVTTAGATIAHGNAKSGGCAALGNVCGTWGSTYGNLSGGSILKVVRNIYYISGTSLYRRDVNNVESELIPNIEDMQVTYGVAATAAGSATSYQTANNVGDWSLVKSVHIEILVRSPDDNLTTAKQKYYFNGADVTATDNRLRLVLSTTIAIRNRTLQSSS